MKKWWIVRIRYETVVAAIVLLIFCIFLVYRLPAKLPARDYGKPEKPEILQLTPLFKDNEKQLAYMVDGENKIFYFREHEIKPEDR